MNFVVLQDCEMISELPFINWKELQNKSFLITGSTGLIGRNLVWALDYANQKMNLNMKLILPVRDVEAARDLFGNDKLFMSYQLGDQIMLDEKIDYIVHLASPTSSKFFTDNPVDTIISSIEGTRAVLKLAREKSIQKMVYLSTMEVYGFPEKGHEVKEYEVGAFEPMKARNSYPVAKIASESLCYAFFSQFGTPAVVLRATQTFGPGVRYDDSRVFAQFLRCVVEGKDIVLKSKGETERSYLYTADAISAILVGLQCGVPGEAYTIANPETYCSIKEMAELVANDLADGKIAVRIDVSDDIVKFGYAETLYMDLSIEKMEALGWTPQVGLLQAYQRMIQSVSE